jgi:ABC-type arginine/histidine transport system permease subunit
MAVALLGQTGFASPLVQAYTVLFRAVPLILLRLLIWNGPPRLDPLFREPRWSTTNSRSGKTLVTVMLGNMVYLAGVRYLAALFPDRFRPSPIFLANRDRRFEYLEAVIG